MFESGLIFHGVQSKHLSMNVLTSLQVSLPPTYLTVIFAHFPYRNLGPVKGPQKNNLLE